MNLGTYGLGRLGTYLLTGILVSLILVQPLHQVGITASQAIAPGRLWLMAGWRLYCTNSTTTVRLSQIDQDHRG